VVTATVTGTGSLPDKLMLGGVGVQVAPVGAPLHVSANVPVRPLTGVKASV
jgi:hypothetical protein